MYHAIHSVVSKLATSDTVKLTSTNKISNDELNLLEGPEVMANMHFIYASIIQNGTSSWKALAFLRKIKFEEEGFDFRIHFNDDHVPDGIVWMTKAMRKSLVRYGDIIFLDVKKRQHNKLC